MSEQVRWLSRSGLLATMVLVHAAFGMQPPFVDLTYAGAADGIALVPPDVAGYGLSAAAAVALADGRLWLAGSAVGDGSGGSVRLASPAFAMLTAAGTPDPGFGPGHDGQLLLDVPNSTIANVALTGRTLVYIGQSGTTPTAMIGRITDAGVPDTTFDGDGQRFIGGNAFFAGGSEAIFQGVAIQPDGKILAVGAAASVQQGTANICTAVMRFNSEDGSSDTSFGGGTGHVCIAPANGAAAPLSEGSSLALLADGRVLVAGTAVHTGSSGADFSVARLTSAGELDTTFGPAHDGWAFVAFDEGGNLSDIAHAIALDAAGRIVLAGYVATSSGAGTGVARLQPQGELDTTFGTQGRTEIAAILGAQDLQLFADGHVFVGGRSNADARGVAALLRSNGQLEPRFGQGGLYVRTDSNPPDYFASEPRVVAGDYIYFIGGINDADGAMAAGRAVLPLFADGYESPPPL